LSYPIADFGGNRPSTSGRGQVGFLLQNANLQQKTQLAVSAG